MCLVPFLPRQIDASPLSTAMTDWSTPLCGPRSQMGGEGLMGVGGCRAEGPRGVALKDVWKQRKAAARPKDGGDERIGQQVATMASITACLRHFWLESICPPHPHCCHVQDNMSIIYNNYNEQQHSTQPPDWYIAHRYNCLFFVLCFSRWQLVLSLAVGSDHGKIHLKTFHKNKRGCAMGRFIPGEIGALRSPVA